MSNEVYKHGLRLAEAIILADQIATRLPTSPTTPQGSLSVPIPAVSPSPQPLLHETPKSLNAFDYNPHQYVDLTANQQDVIVYSFQVPTGYVFHIEQLAVNYTEDAYVLFIVDGAEREKIQRFYGEINAPVNVTRRFFYARKQVKFVAYNNSSDPVRTEVLCDGTLYNEDDWNKIVDRIAGAS